MKKQKIALMTDSNSGITHQEALHYNLTVLPMPVLIDSKVYYEEQTIDQTEFFKKMEQGAAISTSLPSVTSLTEKWAQLLKRNDHVVYIPMTKSLSSSHQTAYALAKEYDGKITVLDSGRISLPLKQLVLDVYHLIEEGWDNEEIVELIRKTPDQSTIFITVDTFKYLKKGGRIAHSTAFVGETLGIRPILKMRDSGFELYQKVRTIKSGKKRMLQGLIAEIELLPDNAVNQLCLQVAYSGKDASEAYELKDEFSQYYPDHTIQLEPLTLSIASHVGPGAIGIGYTKKLLSYERGV